MQYYPQIRWITPQERPNPKQKAGVNFAVQLGFEPVTSHFANIYRCFSMKGLVDKDEISEIDTGRFGQPLKVH